MIESMLADYCTGNYTVSMIADKYGLSTGKAYYALRDAGCVFIRKWRRKMPDDARKRISEANKGRKWTPEQKATLSESRKCNYNGLNGYGHTKKHCKGYILAYAPLHPNAHKDGYVMLHTILMEREMGRYLLPDEVVHHINHERKDNRIENLMLMKKHDHFSLHMQERRRKEGMTY